MEYFIVCLSQGRVRYLNIADDIFGRNGPFTAEIYYAIAIVITIRFNNGLCTHFCDCDSYFPIEKKRYRNRVINRSCE